MSQKGVSVSANTLRVSPHSGEAVKLMGSRVRRRMMGEQHQVHLPTPDLYVIERHSIQKHTRPQRRHKLTLSRQPQTNRCLPQPPSNRPMRPWGAESEGELLSMSTAVCSGYLSSIIQRQTGGYMCRMHRAWAVCSQSKINSHHVCIEEATLIISADAQPFNFRSDAIGHVALMGFERKLNPSDMFACS